MFKCIHLGCGSRLINGWINVDHNTISERNIKLDRPPPKFDIDLKCDALKPLPFDENSIDYIYNEHFFEHFSYMDGKKMVNDWYRILKPNGILRMAMPSIEETIRVYNDKELFDDIRTKLNDKTRTRGIFINKVFRSFGHRFLYDKETLRVLLEESKLTDIKFLQVGESQHKPLSNLETRIFGVNSYLNSICIETIKK